MDAFKLVPAATQRQRELENHLRELEHQLSVIEERHERDSQYWAQLEAVIDNAPLAIYLKDANHRYLLVNREYEHLAGGKRGQLLGRDDFEVLPLPVAQLFRQQDAEVIAQMKAIEFRETIHLGDGVHSFITSKFPLRRANGELFGVGGVCTEITALEETQRQLAQAQAELVKKEQLAALGELAAVVAHEVRNPLGVIFNALQTIKRTSKIDEQGRLMLDVIDEEAERLNSMVTSLLDLARPEAPRLVLTQVIELVRSSIDAARVSTEPEAEVRLNIPEPLPLALVDEQKMHQALVNLISNALQATGKRGPVVVRVTIEKGQRSMLRVDVIDDGHGVAPELRERVFAPFFTERARGTGLGLAVVRRVAEAHQGEVSVEATPGGGATFVLRVPL